MAKMVETEAHGPGCDPNAVGRHYAAIIDYGGLDARRLTARIPIIWKQGQPAIEMQVVTLASGVGTLRPTGTYVARVLPPIDFKYSGEWAADITLADSQSFTARWTETAPADHCTQAFRITFLRTGR